MERASEGDSALSLLSCEEVRPLLPAAAVGALDRADASGVASHLLMCRVCRHELDRYSETVDYVGFAVPQITPRPSLRRAIVKALAMDNRWLRVPRWATAVAAALIAMLLAGNLAVLLHQFGAGQQSTPLATRAASAPAPQLVWYDLTPDAPAAHSAQGVLCAQQNGNLAWLIVQDLPQLTAGKTYQAWLTSGDQRVSAGTFMVDPRGRGFLTIRLKLPIGRYSFLGVTDEPIGGSPTPTGERLLSATL